MKMYSVTHKADGRIIADDFPDAEKLISVTSPLAKRLMHFSMHIRDIGIAKNALDKINQAEPGIMQEALWFTAVTSFVKCFGKHDARFSLQRNQVFKGNSIAKKNFVFFKSLRDNHFIHEGKLFPERKTFAVLNKRNKPNKIEKIIAPDTRPITLVQDTFSSLYGLILHTSNWLEKEFDDLCDKLMKELEAKSYEELLKFPEARYTLHESKDSEKTS